MIVLALSLSLLIGVSLGLMGGGGSMLTVPILTYVAGMGTKPAIASSLLVVAVTSATGAIAHARAGRVRWRTAVLFGAAGMGGAFVGGRLAGYVPGRTLLFMFIAMMIATAIAMLRGRRGGNGTAVRDLRLGQIVLQGGTIGLVAGLVGAGGGFLIVPALTLLGGLPIEAAVGTSLVVISMQSFAGFLGHLGHVVVDWPLTLAVTGTAVVGSFVGGALASKVSPAALRRGFGVFVLVMAAIMLAKQLG